MCVISAAAAGTCDAANGACTIPVANCAGMLPLDVYAALRFSLSLVR